MRLAETSDAQGDVLRRAARRGDARRVRRGAYVGVDRWAGLDDIQRHVLEVHAAVAAIHTPALVSHRSAAALWGLPLVGAMPSAVHLTFFGNSPGVSRAGVTRHVAQEPVAQASAAGLRLTSVARTVIDLARVDGFLTGVAAGDAALHEGLLTPDELATELERAGRRRGVRVARDVVGFVDGRSESPGESLSRVRMHELGFPPPELQHEIRDRGRFIGRVDFWWEEQRVIGEFDGRSKYGIDESARSATDQLWDEKIREDRLRATGATVVRWTWSDAWAGAPMAARLRQALTQRAHRS